MSTDPSKEIEKLIQQLREAAQQLEATKKSNPDQALQAAGTVLSCCGTCTAVSSIPPCANACIQVSPLF